MNQAVPWSKGIRSCFQISQPNVMAIPVKSMYCLDKLCILHVLHSLGQTTADSNLEFFLKSLKSSYSQRSCDNDAEKVPIAQSRRATRLPRCLKHRADPALNQRKAKLHQAMYPQISCDDNKVSMKTCKFPAHIANAPTTPPHIQGYSNATPGTSIPFSKIQ